MNKSVDSITDSLQFIVSLEEDESMEVAYAKFNTVSLASECRKHIEPPALPSPTWPTIVDLSFDSSRSFFVSHTSSGSFDTGTLRRHQ